MSEPTKRATLNRGRGVTAAQQTFNLSGKGSNPFGPTVRQSGHSWLFSEARIR